MRKPTTSSLEIQGLGADEQEYVTNFDADGNGRLDGEEIRTVISSYQRSLALLLDHYGSSNLTLNGTYSGKGVLFD
jgi:hypothetical protein